MEVMSILSIQVDRREAPLFYTFFLLLSITSPVDTSHVDTPVTWRPYDHAVYSRRVFSAYTRPGRVLTVASDLPQRVEQVLFDEGDRVPGLPDQMVPAIVLDSSVEKQLLEGARISLEFSLNDQERAQLSITRATTAAQIASKELDRMRVLHSRGNASDADLDRQVLAEAEARVALEMALVTQRDATEAVRAAKSEVAVIEARIARLTIQAPGGWRVEERLVEPGAGVVPGAPLMVFADLSAFEIDVPMAEAEIQVLADGPLQIERVSNRTEVRGEVEFVGAVPDARTRKRRVVIRIPAEEFALESPETGGGIELQVTLEVPDACGGVRVPHRFFGRRLEQWVVKTEDGKLHVVSPVRSDDEGWVVLPGDLPAAAVLIEY